MKGTSRIMRRKLEGRKSAHKPLPSGVEPVMDGARPASPCETIDLSDGAFQSAFPEIAQRLAERAAREAEEARRAAAEAEKNASEPAKPADAGKHAVAAKPAVAAKTGKGKTGKGKAGKGKRR